MYIFISYDLMYPNVLCIIGGAANQRDQNNVGVT